MAVVALGDLWGSKYMLHSFGHGGGKKLKFLEDLIRISWDFSWKSLKGG
jgi:hypothetical protein